MPLGSREETASNIARGFHMDKRPYIPNNTHAIQTDPVMCYATSRLLAQGSRLKRFKKAPNSREDVPHVAHDRVDLLRGVVAALIAPLALLWASAHAPIALRA
eukprot:7248381-Alexandrium_andersonii.AAC.1